MTLSFSQKFKDGTPTHFVQKIWNGLIANQLSDIPTLYKYEQEHEQKFGQNWYLDLQKHNSFEIHTIRADKSNRWKVGNKTHMVINNRTPNRFQFAPIVKVKQVQKIRILRDVVYEGDCKVYIEGDLFYDNTEVFESHNPPHDYGLEQLAINDGFDSVFQFFEWFSEDFEGKIIHWTDLKY